MKSGIINKMQCYENVFQWQLSFNYGIKIEFLEEGVPFKQSPNGGR